MSLFSELKRRNVFRVAIAYLAAAWLLTEIADTLFPAFGIPDWAFRFVVLALGFVAVDRLWLGSQTAREQPVHPEVTAGEARPAEAQAQEAAESRRSIAVLPFANRSANPDDVFFVEGIHDDLLTHISRISAIKTISRTSVLHYRDTDMTIPEIARELGVATILEGGVQRAGDHVRINVQLIDARTDEHLWSEIYDRQLTTANIFAIQTEIAESIAAALEATLSPAEERRLRDVPTRDLAAYEAYLIGRQRLEEQTTESIAEAVRYFGTALERDPGFALAWVGLADAYLEQGDMGVAPSEMFQKAKGAAESALKLDDELGEAHTTLGTVKFRKQDTEGAERSYRRAIELNPNYPQLKDWYGIFLANSGRWDEALEWRAAAVELDPMSPWLRRGYAASLRAMGRNEEALRQLERALEINPEFTPALDAIATIQWQVFNRHAESVQVGARLILLDPYRAENMVWLAQHYLDLGEPGRAESLVDRATELAPDYWLNNWGRLLLGVEQQASVKIALEAAAILAEGYGGFAAHWHWQIAAAQMRNLALSANRSDEALAIYSQHYPELLADDAPVIDLRNYRAAIDLALVLQKKGDKARADMLLDRSSRFIAGQPRLGWWGGYWISDVQILALQGRKDEALAALRKAYDEGWRTLWWYYLVSDPNLESIRDDPRFQAVLADIKVDMAVHMEQIRGMEARGEIEQIPGVKFDPS